MTRDEITRRFPNASEAFIRANGDQGSGAPAVAQCPVRSEPLAAAQTQKGNRGRFFVRLTSVRNRLLDEDNLCPKFHVDLLRYAGIIPSDAPDRTSIRTTQRKCQEYEAEHVEIEIDYQE